MPKGYDVWLFYESHINKVLKEAQPVNGVFAGQLMTTYRVGASKLLSDSTAQRFNELLSQDQRAEQHAQVG